MKVLTEQERQAAKILLESVNRVSSYSYSELSQMLVPPVNPRFVLPTVIGNVSHLCFELGLPLLSAKVIGKISKKAGDGFFKLYCDFFPEAKSEEPTKVWRSEMERIQLWDDWSPLLDYLKIDIVIPTSPKKLKQQVGFLEKQIRILPMSKTLEFQNYSVEDIQQKYFLGDLIDKQNGLYYFRETGMNCTPKSFILFQFENKIVASATLKAVHRYDHPVEGIYKGAFEFFQESIEVFDAICIEEINVIEPNITRFSQVKQIINWDSLDDLKKLIALKKTTLYPDEIQAEERKTYIEGAKKKIIVNAYERNPEARKDCIKENGCKCVVCGFDFGATYGEQFYGKIHVHHINPLYLIDNAYELNPKTDLVPVCPNCHMVLHSKENGVFSIDEVKAFINKKS